MLHRHVPLDLHNALRLQAKRYIVPHGAPWKERRILEHHDARRNGPITGSPSSRNTPERGGSSPATSRSKVDLPQPEGPSSATNSPGLTLKFTSSSTGSTLPSISKAWLTCSTSSGAPTAGYVIGLGQSVRYHFTTPLLPDQQPVAGAEQQRDRAGAHQRHHDQRRIHVGIGGPALRPLQIPAEPGLDADHLGDDQHGKRCAEAHEQADENMRQRRGNGDLEHQEPRLAPSVRAMS